jgi:hypothetical protein
MGNKITTVTIVAARRRVLGSWVLGSRFLDEFTVRFQIAVDSLGGAREQEENVTGDLASPSLG